MKAAQCAGDELWERSWEEAAGEKTIQERSNSHSTTVLYCSWFCPFAQRAWIALEEKGVDYRYTEINPYEVNPAEPGGYTKKALSLAEKARLMPDLIHASPRGLVPAIDFNGNPIWESVPLIEFVDEQFDGPSLMPRDPVLRAQVRIWTAHATERMQKTFYIMLMSQDIAAQEHNREIFFEECRILSRAMAGTGPYFLGESFSMVDIALAPFWQVNVSAIAV